MPELKGDVLTYEDYVLAAGGIVSDTTPDQQSEYELPDTVNRFHTYDDRDTPQGSHHTLGKGQFQASPGPHTHDGKNSLLLSSDTTMLPITDINATDVSALVNTTYATPSQICGLTFKAPPSGKGLIVCHVRLDFNFSGASPLSRSVRTCPVLRDGASIGSGTDPNLADDGTQALPNDDITTGAIVTHPTGTGALGAPPCHGVVPVEGLIPGNDYNIFIQTKCNSATTFNYDILYQMIGWRPAS
jgi:hypothetical protein